MKWVRDRTGRFEWRPFYEQREIDVHCEDVVSRFRSERGCPLDGPISTDDLTVLIEQDVSDLDLFANLLTEGRDIEGVTEFHPRKRPSVRIAKYLSQSPTRVNRLRSTLSHEYGHVVFHDFLWTLDPHGASRTFNRREAPRCRRSRIVTAPQRDWMEWQAGYAGGAFLMPVTALTDLVEESLREWGLSRWVESGTGQCSDMVQRAAEAFAVSKDGARTRLTKLGYIVPAAAR